MSAPCSESAGLYRQARREKYAKGVLQFVERNIPATLPVFRKFFRRFVPAVLESEVVEDALIRLDSFTAPELLSMSPASFAFMSLLSPRVRAFQTSDYFRVLAYSLHRKDLALLRMMFGLFLGGDVTVRFGTALARFIVTHTDRLAQGIEGIVWPSTGLGLFTDMEASGNLTPVVVLMLGFDLDPILRRRLFTDDLHGAFERLWTFLTLIKPVRLQLALFSVLSFYHAASTLRQNAPAFNPSFDSSLPYRQFDAVRLPGGIYRAKQDVLSRHDGGIAVPMSDGDAIDIGDAENWFRLRGMTVLQSPLDDPAVAGTPFAGGEYFAADCSVPDATVSRVFTDESFRVFLFEARRPILWVRLSRLASEPHWFCGASRMGAPDLLTEEGQQLVTDEAMRLSGGLITHPSEIRTGFYVRDLSLPAAPSSGYYIRTPAGWERKDNFTARPFIFYFNWTELAAVQKTPLYSLRIAVDRMERGGIVDLPQGF